jgi:hypothetical protein
LKKEFLTATFHPFYFICTNYNTNIIDQVFLCNWFNINMRVPISIGGLFSEKILLSVRNFHTFVFKITTFHLFKKYYNTHLQSETFYILNILSLSVIKITKRNIKTTLFASSIDNTVVFKENNFTLEYAFSGSWICSKNRNGYF